MPIKNIIWDWNGTLVNDIPLTVSIANKMLAKRGLSEISIEYYREIYQHPISKVYEATGFNLKKEKFEVLSHEWHEDYLKQIVDVSLFEDSIEMLEFCKLRNINQSILSALPHDILLESLKHHKIENYFCYTKGLSHRLANSKIDNGHELMRELNFLADETILIGDSKHDVETAEALGVNCILVSRGFESKERLTEYQYVIYDDLLSIKARLT